MPSLVGVLMEDFQRQAGVQGRSFEDAVTTLLKVAGWSVVEVHAKVEGAEIDIIADSPVGTRWWIECKGSWRGKTPGSKRGDTVKKAVGVAWYLSQLPDRLPYMLVTSHMPKDGTLGARMLDEAVKAGLFAEINTLGFLATVVTEDDDEDEDDEI